MNVPSISFHTYTYYYPLKHKEGNKHREENILYISGEDLIQAERAYAGVGVERVSFGYHHPLKTQFVKGRLPWLQVGFYGEKLTKKNVSIEHLEPVAEFKKKYSSEKAKRLATTWENIVLASNRINNLRGCDPLSAYIDYEAMCKYLQQFEGKWIPGFGPGEKYIKGILNTVNRLIQENR